MYKDTSQSQTFRERVASDSTKPLATGVVNVLPPDARPWEEIFLGLRQQIEETVERLDKVREQLYDVNWKLKQTHPRLQFEHLVRYRAQLCEKQEHYGHILKDLRQAGYYAAQNSFAYCFLTAAQTMLTDEMYSALINEARELSRDAASQRPLPKAQPPEKGNGLNRTSFRNAQTKLLHPTSLHAQKLFKEDKKWLMRGSG